MVVSGTTMAAAGFCNPGIECEIAIRPHKASDGAGYTIGSVADLIDTVIPAIENVENQFGKLEEWRTSTLIVDDFSHKARIIGPALSDWESLDCTVLSEHLRIYGEEKAG